MNLKLTFSNLSNDTKAFSVWSVYPSLRKVKLMSLDSPWSVDVQEPPNNVNDVKDVNVEKYPSVTFMWDRFRVLRFVRYVTVSILGMERAVKEVRFTK